MNKNIIFTTNDNKNYVLSIKKVVTIPLIKQLSTSCVLGLGVGHGDYNSESELDFALVKFTTDWR